MTSSKDKTLRIWRVAIFVGWVCVVVLTAHGSVAIPYTPYLAIPLRFCGFCTLVLVTYELMAEMLEPNL